MHFELADDLLGLSSFLAILHCFVTDEASVPKSIVTMAAFCISSEGTGFNFVDVLKIVKRYKIERLLKGFDLGMQFKFEDKLEKWRESIGIPLSPVDQDFRSTSSSSISSTRGSNTKTPTRFMPYQRSTPSPDNACIGMMLADILNETSRGKGLVDYYNKFLSFHEDQRSVLISLIAHYYEEKGVKMSLTASYQLEKQILERFPSEKLVIYNYYYYL